jgi:hypothetical protein
MIFSQSTLARRKAFLPLWPNPGVAVSTHTILEVDPYPAPTSSALASGARLKPIRSIAALTFFERFAAPVEDNSRHVDAWGAFEDGGKLLDIAVQAASHAGGRRLIGSHPAGASAARRFAESQTLLPARRVKNGQAAFVLFIPEQPARTSGGRT